MSTSMSLPFDVRLMNFTTAVLASGLLLAAVAAGLWWVLRNPMFTIGQITVTGDTRHNSAASLRAAVEPRLKGNFFTLDLGAAQAAFERAPWVRKATVRREFPNRLSIDLQEYVPVAQWGEGDTHLVDAKGHVFEVSDFDSDDSDLPMLIGPDGQAEQVLDMYRALDPLIEPLDVAIATLELQPRGHWHVVLDSGADIELGQGSQADLVARSFISSSRFDDAKQASDLAEQQISTLQQPINLLGHQAQQALLGGNQQILHGMRDFYPIIQADDPRRALERMRRTHAGL